MEGWHWLVVGNGAWAKDADRKAAIRKLHGEGATVQLTYRVHPETYVDGMGFLTYPQGEEPVKVG